MVTRSEIATLHSMLDQQLAGLRAELGVEVAAEAGERYRDVAGEVTDSGDAAVANEITDIDDALIGRHVKEVREIEAALARIAAGNYGRCSGCGGQIGFARLAASPATEHCEPCEAVRQRALAGAPHTSL